MEHVESPSAATSLRARIDKAAALWQLEIGDALHDRGGAIRVEARTRDGREAVLELPHEAARGGNDRAAALQAWGGRATPELLAHDDASGAVLLERIRPGGRTGELDAATVAPLLHLLRVPPFDGARPLTTVVAQRIETAERRRHATPQRIAWAREALESLTHEAPAPTLLHGAFDERCLRTCTRRGVVAIDPVPYAGDPLYDAATWVHGDRRPGRRARFEALAAALGLDDAERSRLRDWCGVVAVLR